MLKRKNIFYLIATIFCNLFLFSPGFSINPELSVQTGHTFGIKKLAFSNDGKIIGSLSEDLSLLLWDTKTGRQIRQINLVEKVIDFTFHSDSKRISLINSDNEILTIDYSNDSIISRVKSDRISLNRILKLKDSNHFIVADSSGLALYDSNLQTMNVEARLDENEVLRQVHLSEDENFIYVLIFTNSKKWVNLDLKMKYFSIKDLKEISLKNITRSKKVSISSKFAFSNDQVLFIGQYEYLYQMRLKNDSLIKVRNYAAVEKTSQNISSLCTHKKAVYVGITNGDIHIYDSEISDYVDVLKGHSTAVKTITVDPTSNYIISGDREGLILVWDLKTRKLIHALEGRPEQITSFKFNKDQSKVVIGYLDGSLKFWNRITQETKKINLQNEISKAKKGMNYVITDITEFSNDSVVKFDCIYSLSKIRFTYSSPIHYSGKWNILTNNIELIEISTDFGNSLTINSPSNFHHLYYEPVEENPHLSDTFNTINVKTDRITLTISGKGWSKEINTHHQTYISMVKIIGESVFTSSWDGTIKEFDINSGREKMTLGISGRSGFFYYLPNGNYYASKSALKFLAFRIGEKIFPFDQFDLIYNRPDIILDSLPFVDNDVVFQFRNAYEKRLSRTVNKTITENSLDEIPIIEVTVPSLTVKDGKINITVTATDPKSMVTDIHILVNGVQENKIIFTSDKRVTATYQIQLGYEMNNIVIYAENTEGYYSLKEEYNILNSQRIRKPDLYLVTIGSGNFSEQGFNLDFAAKDAKDIRDYFISNENYNEIRNLHFEDGTVKKEIVKEISMFLKDAGVNDHVVLFYAGHGILDGQYNYYLSTYDVSFNSPSANGISYNELEEIINSSSARQKLLLIDACHSGEIDKEAVKEISHSEKQIKGKIKFRSNSQNSLFASGALELSKVIFTNTDNKNGTAIISASGGGELAIESNDWKNGLFTYALLNGLKKSQADENNDGVIVISELQGFVNKTVVKLSEGSQTPNARSENLLNDFVIKK